MATQMRNSAAHQAQKQKELAASFTFTPLLRSPPPPLPRTAKGGRSHEMLSISVGANAFAVSSTAAAAAASSFLHHPNALATTPTPRAADPNDHAFSTVSTAQQTHPQRPRAFSYSASRSLSPSTKNVTPPAGTDISEARAPLPSPALAAHSTAVNHLCSRQNMLVTSMSLENEITRYFFN